MQTTVLCIKQDKDAAIKILKTYKELGIKARAIAVGKSWQFERTRLDEQVASSSHLLVPYTEELVHSSWLSFLAGYCLGTEKPLLLYSLEGKKKLPAFLSPFFYLSAEDELRAFLETERRDWLEVHERREARRKLLELGVSSRQESLVDSVSEGNIHAVVLFLKAGFSPDGTDKRGVPLLCIAAREQHGRIISLLLENGANINKQSADRGNSALMDAVAISNYKIAEELVRAGADVNLLSKDGQSALILAVGKSDAKLSRLLIEAGADLDMSDKLGFSARKYAKLFRNSAILDLFQETLNSSVEE